MKNLFILFLFVSSSCFAQTYIGTAKKDIVKALKEAKATYKDTLTGKVNWVQFQEQNKLVTLYMSKDSVQYFTVLSPLAEINKTIEAYNKEFQRQDKWRWIDYSQPKHELIFEIKKFTDGFLSIISVSK